MGRLILNPCAITNFTINIVKENANLDVIHLTIDTEDGSLKYRICCDDREPNLLSIQNQLNAGLSQVLNGNVDIELREYIERDYLFIKYPNGVTKQYTARKI
ncbi:hypothetical protein [Fibrobacter sp. UWB5]|uniref:hypothetical protein n=1 Tax=Fibrobacter sp. UWB5 TaxID=1964360 RepID=UPI000B523C77|nr:hypothetical protein [Fibrobacter sp. UWB5]OWV09653.1 hypothetical protein B7989_12730 [Fibrobacter sp. UWB5]